MKFGYIHVYGTGEEETAQAEALKRLGVDPRNIHVEGRNGDDEGRPERTRALALLREGDTFAAESIARVARTAQDFLSVMDAIRSRGAKFVSIKESIDTGTPDGAFVMDVFGAMAELERASIWPYQRGSAGA